MFTNYLKVLLRSLIKYKVISFINIFGLAIAVACSILIFYYLHYEFSYDTFHDRSEDIFLANRYDVREGREPYYNQFHNTSAYFAGSIQETIPEVEMAIRVTDGNSIVRYDNEVFEHYVNFVDPSFFDLFNFPFLEGQADKDIKTIVLTESFAKRYFPNESAIGKILDIEIWGKFSEYMVSGVVKNPPSNTRFQGEFFFPFQIIEDYYGNIYGDLWNLGFSQTYVRLADGANPAEVEEKILKVMDDLGITTYWGKFGTQYYHLQPFTKVHLALKNDRGFPTDTTNLGAIILLCVGFVIILIAVINYSTLSAGKSNIRWREIGVRKVLGANRHNLRVQFWFETVFLVLTSIILGAVISELLLPLFSSMAEIEISDHQYLQLLPLLLSLLVVLTLSVGLYPVSIMTDFPIQMVFRGYFKFGSKATIRRILVFFQFAMSICLIAATIIMSHQMLFIKNSNLGLDKDYLLEVNVANQDNTGVRSLELMRQALQSDPYILNISGASCSIGSSWTKYEWNVDGKQYSNVYANTVDYNYLNTMNIKLLRGRNFSQSGVDSAKALIVNESFVKAMGWENGTRETIPGIIDEREIIGVVEDYTFLTMHDQIYPMVLSINPGHMGNLPDRRKRQTNPSTIQRLYFRLLPDHVPVSIAKIEKEWKKINPDIPFDYSFLSKIIDMEYKSDQNWQKVVLYSSILAILLATFGLVGHTIMQVTQKTQEIGVRKILGGSPVHILRLMSREITILVILANLVAWPAAWFSMNKWLEYFANRIDMTVIPMVAASILVLIIAWLTTGALVYRAATRNPADCLRQD